MIKKLNVKLLTIKNHFILKKFKNLNIFITLGK